MRRQVTLGPDAGGQARWKRSTSSRTIVTRGQGRKLERSAGSGARAATASIVSPAQSRAASAISPRSAYSLATYFLEPACRARPRQVEFLSRRAVDCPIAGEVRRGRRVTMGGLSTCSGASRRAPDVPVRRGMDRFSEFELRLLEN